MNGSNANYIRITEEPFTAVAIDVKSKAQVDVTEFLRDKIGPRDMAPVPPAEDPRLVELEKTGAELMEALDGLQKALAETTAKVDALSSERDAMLAADAASKARIVHLESELDAQSKRLAEALEAEAVASKKLERASKKQPQG